MKIKHIVITFLYLIFGLSSCSNFKLKFPISNSLNSEIDQDLLGNWLLLDENDSTRYPILQAEVFKFNDREYVSNCELMEHQGREVSSLITYKIFNSKIKNNDYLNLQALNDPKNEFMFYRIEEYLIDSLHIRVITDSLKTEFKNSLEFKTFLECEENLIDKGFLSQVITFRRWNSINWDMVNKVDKSSNIEEFFIIGRVDEEEFINYSDSELIELIIGKDRVEIGNIEKYFSNITLVKYSNGFWKVPRYGVLKLKSGKLIKIKYDTVASNFLDLTNKRLYRNLNKQKVN